MGNADSKILQQARRNGGAITQAEMMALGMPKSTVQRRVSAGWLVRAGPGTYVLPGVSDEWRAILTAATRRLEAVASHEAAAGLHGFRGVKQGALVVSVPVRRSNRFPGVKVHQSTDLTAAHTTEADGIPVTTPARTLFDLASTTSEKQLRRIVSFAFADRLVTREEVEAVFKALARRGKPGTTRMRKILFATEGIILTSELEVRFIELITSASIPMPVTQFRAPWLKMIDGRIDFAYPNRFLLVEVDGFRWHNDEDTFLRDRERDNIAQLAGWRTLRFTWKDITERPSWLISTLRHALEAPISMQIEPDTDL